MMARAGLRAGLVGAIVGLVLALVSLVPCLGCIVWLLALVTYVGAGVLAAYWLPPPRLPADGAGAGAIAGAITAFVYGVVNMILGAAQFSMMGGRTAIMRQMPPEALRQMRDAGIDPDIFTSIGGIVGISAVCCTLGLVLAAVLGAVGGAIMASARRE
jgi:hypothetical protein